MANGVVENGAPVQDSAITSGYPGFINEVPSGQTPASTDNLKSNFLGTNVDWVPTNNLLLSGPSSGVATVASSNFTVAANALTTSTVVTPNDSGAGGTFSPTTLTLSGSGSGTFTYTASAPGTFTISITNNQAATNPAPLTYTASAAPQSFTFPNSSLFESPGVWRNSGGAAICQTAGCYLRFRVTADANPVILGVNVTANSSLSAIQYPVIKVVYKSALADSPASFYQLSSGQTSQTIASGLTSGTAYDFFVWYIGAGGTGNNWSGTEDTLTLTNLQIGSGATLSSSTLRPKRALFLGDSYLQSYFGGATGGAPNTYEDFSNSWPFFVSATLGCEYGQVGIGSQGWLQSGNNSFPAFPSTWNYYSSGNSKTMYGLFDYVVIAQGTNDHHNSSSGVQSAVTSFVPQARTAFGPNTKLFFLINIAQIQASAIKAGLAAAADPNTYVIDMGTEYANTVFDNGFGAGGGTSPSITWASPDGFHLDAIHQGFYSAMVAQQIQKALTVSGGSFAFSQ